MGWIGFRWEWGCSCEGYLKGSLGVGHGGSGGRDVSGRNQCSELNQTHDNSSCFSVPSEEFLFYFSFTCCKRMLTWYRRWLFSSFFLMRAECIQSSAGYVTHFESWEFNLIKRQSVASEAKSSRRPETCATLLPQISYHQMKSFLFQAGQHIVFHNDVVSWSDVFLKTCM